MTLTSNDRLVDLRTFPRGAVPTNRRDGMNVALQERRATIGRAVSSGALVVLSVSFGIFYGSVSIYAWMRGLHPIGGVLFSVLSGGMLISSAVLGKPFEEHLRKIARIPERLRLEAETESKFDLAVMEFNIAAMRWNDAAKIAMTTDVGAHILDALLSQRAALERRKRAIDGNLRRFIAVTAPVPDAQYADS